MTIQKSRTAYMLAGLPGSGKSTAVDIGKTITNGSVLRSGEMIREMARRDGLENPTSEELGQYAKEQRDIAGHSFFAEKVIGMILRGEIGVEYPVWIDSVRHVDGARQFREFFDTSYLIYLHAGFATRLERIKGRGREGEGEWDSGDLISRDNRELEHLGTQTILDSDQIDYRVSNNGSIDDLHDKIHGIVNGFEPDPDKCEGCIETAEAMSDFRGGEHDTTTD